MIMKGHPRVRSINVDGNCNHDGKGKGKYAHVPSEPVIIGDSVIFPISDPRPDYWMSAAEQKGKCVFTPGGVYQPEKFPGLESLFAEWKKQK
jgi:hypothetical protein